MEAQTRALMKIRVRMMRMLLVGMPRSQLGFEGRRVHEALSRAA